MATVKDTRLEIRSTREQKSILEKAADITGLSVSGFVLASALKEAQHVLHEHFVTTLSIRDWDHLLEILQREEKNLNKPLREAFQDFSKKVSYAEDMD